MANLFESIQNRKTVYCAFCKSPRRVYKKKHVSVIDVLNSALIAGVLIAAVYLEFHPYFFILWVFFLCLSEFFIQIRWRINIVCKHCGFDPVLYLKNPMECAQKVKSALEARKEDPSFWLSSTAMNLPKISSERKKELEKEERMMMALREQKKSQKNKRSTGLSNVDEKKGVLISKVL